MQEFKLNNINEYLINGQLLYAHIENNKEPELISEHSEKTIGYFYKLSEIRGSYSVIKNIIYNFRFEGKKINGKQAKFMLELFVNAIYLHDLGKINPAFQFIKMKNHKIVFDNTADTADSNHSLLSALIYIDIFIEKVKNLENRTEKQFLRYIIFSFAYIISRHHTFLKDFGEVDFLQDLKVLHTRIQNNSSYLRYYKNYDRLKNNLNLNLFGEGNIIKNEYVPTEFYILAKLLYSSIVSCDFYATYNYDTDNEPQLKVIDNIGEILKVYENTTIYKGIQAYKNNKNHFGKGSINALRSEMFLEAEKNLVENIDKYNIFYLEAPTGGGKTNISINLALKIAKILPDYNKILYIFPFNTLIEQTKSIFDSIFNDKFQKHFRVCVINSITPIVTESEKNESEDCNENKIDNKKDYLNRQMIQYPVVLTTHVNYFNYLFGIGRELNLPLIHLCNSVVIIDEVQSYRNKIWPEIIEFLNAYSKNINMKIIIMSATLPKLDKLLNEKSCGFYELIKNKIKYQQNELFKNRVKLNFKMLTKDKISDETLLYNINKVMMKRTNSRVLIEFIKKSTARYFFNKIKEIYPNKKVYEITGDDSNFIRGKILDAIKEVDEKDDFICKDFIIIATQVIESGVDIDTDIGFKDISILDGEEQFLGRINRSCKRKNCEAFFFNYDAAEKIYKKDFRLEFDLRNNKYQEYLTNKNFEKFYDNCFKRLQEKKIQNNEENIKNLEEAALYLNFEKVNNIMKLIKEENYQLFLAHKIELNNGEIIDGSEVWKEYKRLITNKHMEYTSKKIQLSNLSEKMDYFTFNYNDFDDRYDRKPKLSNEVIGKIYYVADGKNFMTNDGKFDREKYEKHSKGLIL